MREHFPELIGLCFVAAILAIFLFASALRSPLLLPIAAVFVGLVIFQRQRAKRRRA